MAGTLQDLVDRINEIAGPGFVGLLQNPDRLLARRVFFDSMTYLVGLFIAVLVDVNVTL